MVINEMKMTGTMGCLTEISFIAMGNKISIAHEKNILARNISAITGLIATIKREIMEMCAKIEICFSLHLLRSKYIEGNTNRIC